MEKLILYILLGMIIIFLVLALPIGIFSTKSENIYIQKDEDVKNMYAEVERQKFQLLESDIQLNNSQSFTLFREKTCEMRFKPSTLKFIYKPKPGETLGAVDVVVIINRIKSFQQRITPIYDTTLNGYVIDITDSIIGYGIPRKKDEDTYAQTIFFVFWNCTSCYDLNKENKQTVLLDICPESWLGTVAIDVEFDNFTCDVCATCGKGIFNLCDKEECHELGKKCYFSGGLTGGRCYDCEEFIGIKNECNVFTSEDACIRCPDAVGTFSGKKCIWVDKWFGGSCQDAEGLGCDVCLATTGENVEKEKIKEIIDRVFEEEYSTYDTEDYKKIIGALMYQESKCNQFDEHYKTVLCSFKGAVGIMQLLPETAAEVKVNPCNLEENIKGGIRYFIQQYENFCSLVEFALAAYNAGPTKINELITNKCGGTCYADCFNAIKNYLPQETQIYVDNIINNRNNDSKNCYIVSTIT